MGTLYKISHETYAKRSYRIFCETFTQRLCRIFRETFTQRLYRIFHENFAKFQNVITGAILRKNAIMLHFRLSIITQIRGFNFCTWL
jgi:hypothetical protein